MSAGYYSVALEPHRCPEPSGSANQPGDDHDSQTHDCRGTDRDLYPFCSNAGDGKFVAVGANVKHLLGTDIRGLKDPTGKAYGIELYAAAQKPEGQVTEVSYMFTQPGDDKTPVPKVTFVTKAGDLGCGVGYYK